MKKIIRLTESDLTRIVKRVIKEYAPYDRSIDDLEGSFQKKYDDKYLRYRNDDVEITSHNPESEADSVLRRDHEDKINKLKTYYKEKIIYDFFQNINLTPEENDKLEDLDEKLSNPNLGSDKIERYKNLKRQIYLGHLNEYLNSLDNRYFGQYFISNNYDYFKDKIKDFAYNDNLPSEPVAPSETVAPTSPNLIQRTANKVKGYFGLSENKRLSERDLSRIVRRVIMEDSSLSKPKTLKEFLKTCSSGTFRTFTDGTHLKCGSNGFISNKNPYTMGGSKKTGVNGSWKSKGDEVTLKSTLYGDKTLK